MSERGVFAVDRGIFDHPVFANEPFTEREAWAWLIGEAAWKPRKRRIGSHIITLNRGQLTASVRFLAERWQWSKSRVDRFLGRLEKRDMIGTDSGTGQVVITVCNYNKYQRVSLPDGTDEAEGAGQQRDSSGTKEKTGKDIEVEVAAPREPSADRKHFDEVERTCRDALGDLAPVDLVVGPLVQLLSTHGPPAIPALIDAARSARTPIRTWRLLATIAAERLTAPAIQPINGGRYGPHRKPSAVDFGRADVERLEREERERPTALRIVSG